MSKKSRLILLAVLAAVLALLNLGGYDLWPPDEPRFAEVAREMRQSGDYLVPRINGEPYKEKPPLLFWTQAVCAVPFGDVTETPTRLPSALAGIATVLLTYALVRRLYDERTAFWAGLILATTQRFWWQTHFGQIDMLLTACLTGAFLSFWLWYTGKQRRYLLAFYLLIAAGAYAKGPPALVFPLLMALTFLSGRKEERRQLHLVTGTLGVLVLVALWLVPARMAASAEAASGAGAGIAGNLIRQTVGRFIFGISHANPPWYYLEQLPVDLLPWALFLPWTVLWVWQRRKGNREMRFLLSWILPALIFFSISLGKRSVYLLPLYPAFAALLARSVLDLMEGGHERWRYWTGVVWGLALVAAGFAPWALLLTEDPEMSAVAPVAAGAFALGAGAYALWNIHRGRSWTLAAQMAAATAVLLVCVSLVALPMMNAHKSAREFCRPLRALSQLETPYHLYALAFFHEEFIYYAEHDLDVVPDGLLEIEALQDRNVFQQGAFQMKAMHAIRKGVAGVDISAIDHMSDADLERLRAAINAKGKTLGEDPETVEAFERAVVSLLEGLLEKLDDGCPDYILAEETDWRWALALCPKARNLAVVRDQKVGSRRVLLLANPSGETLLSEVSAVETQVDAREHASRNALAPAHATPRL